MASSDAEAPFRVNNPNCTQHVLEVGEWLAHAHEHNIVDLLSGPGLDGDDLVNNFVRGQIAGETFQTARAKFAAVSATDLGRDTDRSTVRSFTIKRRRRWNQNRFDQISVGQTKKKLSRCIARAEYAHNVNLTKRKCLQEPLTEWLRQIGHFVDRVDALLVKP